MSSVATLDERITIENETTTRASNGEVTTSYSQLATVWADATPTGGTESYKGEINLATQNYRFLIRHRTDISNRSRILWDGKYYDVKFIQPYFKSGRNNFIEIKASYADNKY